MSDQSNIQAIQLVPTSEDGGMTLSKDEVFELKEAYEGLYNTLNFMPSSVCDFFSTRRYLNIGKWLERLNGRVFNRSDWIDEDYDEDSEEIGV